MAMTFEKAEKSQVRLRVALIGPSGSGKSFSALRLAKGMAETMGPDTKIGLIDTEGRRSEYYADEFDFSVLHLHSPFHPERYIEAIETAEDGGFGVIIVDSCSHEWIGEGGILDLKDKMGGNPFTAWKELTPRHNHFLEKIIHSSSHIIATIRGKDAYVLEEQEKGGKKRQVPKKVGLGGEQRTGFEYEFTATFLLDQGNHVATPSKDNTHIFDGARGEKSYGILTEKQGRALIQWASKGKEAPPPPPKANESTGRNGSGNGKKRYSIEELRTSAETGIKVLQEAGALADDHEEQQMKEHLVAVWEDRKEINAFIRQLKTRFDEHQAITADRAKMDTAKAELDAKKAEREAKEAKLKKAGLKKGAPPTTTSRKKKATPGPTQEEEQAGIVAGPLPKADPDPVAAELFDNAGGDVAAKKASDYDDGHDFDIF